VRTCHSKYGRLGCRKRPARAPPGRTSMATKGCPRLGKVAHHRSSATDQIGKQPGKQLLKDPSAAWQQRMNVPSLRRATTVLAIRRQAARGCDTGRTTHRGQAL
jgi:hypothetical protein